MKSFGDLFNSSVKEYTDKFTPIIKSFLVLYVIPSLLIILVMGIIFLSTFSSSNLYADTFKNDFTGMSAANFLFDSGINAIWMVVLALVFLVYLVSSVLLSISYINIGFSKDKNISFSKSFAVSKKFFWSYVGLWLLTIIALVGLFILLIIPGIIFLVFWMFSSYVLMNEKTGIVEAMKRSKKMVKGRWWRTFGIVLLLFVIAAVFSLVMSLLPVLGALISAVVLEPFITLFLKNMYLDMKKK